MFKFEEMSSISNLIYGTRLCYESFGRADNLGKRDRALLKNIVKLKHYSPLNLIWYKFTRFNNEIYMQWVQDNPAIQHFVLYDPSRKELLVNARTLKESENDYISKKMIEQVIDKTPVIFGETEANKQIVEETVTEIENADYARIVDVFPKQRPQLYFVDVKGLTRALLQQFIRHRQYPLVKSTRYTLKEALNGLDMLYYTDNSRLDANNEDTIREISYLLSDSIPNDIVKYLLPEAYKTHIFSVFSKWSIENMLEVRTGKAVMREWDWIIKELGSAYSEV